MKKTEEFFQIVKTLITEIKDQDKFETRLGRFCEFVSGFARTDQKEVLCFQFNEILKFKGEEQIIIPDNLMAKQSQLAAAITRDYSFEPNKLYAVLEEVVKGSGDLHDLIHTYKIQNAVIDQDDYQQRIETSLAAIRADMRELANPLMPQLKQFISIVGRETEEQREQVGKAILSALNVVPEITGLLKPDILKDVIEQKWTHCPPTVRYNVFVNAVASRLPWNHPLRQIHAYTDVLFTLEKKKIHEIFMEGFRSSLIHLESPDSIHNRVDYGDECKEQDTGRATNLNRDEVIIANRSFDNHVQELLRPLKMAAEKHDNSLSMRGEFESMVRENKSSAQKIANALDYLEHNQSAEHYPERKPTRWLGR